MLLYRLIHGICLECIACGGPGNYIIHGIWLERIACGGPGNYIITHYNIGAVHYN